MLKAIGHVFDHEMKLSEFLGVLILVGIPYFLVGVAWTLTHTAHLDNVQNNVDKVVSFLGSIVCWPVLLISNVTMT